MSTTTNDKNGNQHKKDNVSKKEQTNRMMDMIGEIRTANIKHKGPIDLGGVIHKARLEPGADGKLHVAVSTVPGYARGIDTAEGVCKSFYFKKAMEANDEYHSRDYISTDDIFYSSSGPDLGRKHKASQYRRAASEWWKIYGYKTVRARFVFLAYVLRGLKYMIGEAQLFLDKTIHLDFDEIRFFKDFSDKLIRPYDKKNCTHVPWKPFDALFNRLKRDLMPILSELASHVEAIETVSVDEFDYDKACLSESCQYYLFGIMGAMEALYSTYQYARNYVYNRISPELQSLQVVQGLETDRLCAAFSWKEVDACSPGGSVGYDSLIGLRIFLKCYLMYTAEWSTDMDDLHYLVKDLGRHPVDVIAVVTEDVENILRIAYDEHVICESEITYAKETMDNLEGYLAECRGINRYGDRQLKETLQKAIEREEEDFDDLIVDDIGKEHDLYCVFKYYRTMCEYYLDKATADQNCRFVDEEEYDLYRYEDEVKMPSWLYTYEYAQ